MKVALIHDYLNQYGGAERVLNYLLELFPGAPVYTAFYDAAATDNRFEGAAIQTSFLDFPLARRRHRWFIPFLPSAMKRLDLSNRYDLIISAGAGFAKGVSYGPQTRHLYYCYTPIRYAWEADYLKKVEFWISNFELTNILCKPVFAYLRHWDYRTAQRPEKILAVSGHIAQKIRRYYGREAEVLYPPVDGKKFFYEPSLSVGDYCLAVSRLIEYKNVDLIIEAFNQLGWPLKIVGAGRAAVRLRRLIRSPRIELLSFVGDDQLRLLYARARGLVFAGVEDFGLVMAEAQACGTPVIAMAAGGALEIVRDGETGLFFKKPIVAELVSALNQFETLNFDRNFIAVTARRFSVENFKKSLLAHVG